MADLAEHAHLEGIRRGLLLRWSAPGTNASNLRCDPGLIYVPNPGMVAKLSAQTAFPAGAFAANTMYYAYAYVDAAGALALDPLSTVPPTSLSAGVTRVKGPDPAVVGSVPDPTRVYVGNVKTNAEVTPRMWCFERFANGDVFYKEHVIWGVEPFSLSNGIAIPSTGATVHLGATATAAKNLVPPTVRGAFVNRYVSSGFNYTQTDDDPLGNSVAQGLTGVGSAAQEHLVPLNASQQFIWAGGTVYAFIRGYREDL